MTSYFNPHSPCGERLGVRVVRPTGEKFQSTLPLRGATRLANGSWRSACHFNPHSPCGERRVMVPPVVMLPRFQSTLPLRGATTHGDFLRKNINDFNPHSPCGERPEEYRLTVKGIFISIHTPLAGSDDHRRTIPAVSIFQSTLPLRGATDALALSVLS